MVGMSMVVPFLPFYIRELGITDFDELEYWSGIVFSGPFILSFMLTPVWGALGDRFGKKTMVLRAIFGLAISQFLIAKWRKFVSERFLQFHVVILQNQTKKSIK